MPHNFHRPDLPYEGTSLPNDNRYKLLGSKPPPAAMLDGENNYLIDAVRQLDADIQNVEAGVLQGANNPLNAGSLVTTDGNGNIGWIKVQASNIADQSISGSKLIPQTITVNEIQDGAIITSKIDAQAVTQTELADNAVATRSLQPLSVTSGKIANGAVTNINLGPLAVTADKIANQTITATQIANSTITATQIANQTIPSTKLLNQTITAAQIANNTITATQIANQTITATQIANNTITFNQISNSFAATKSQQQSATSSSVFVSPATQQYHPSAASAWVVFDGTDGTILNRYNVSAVSKIGTGIFRVTVSAFINNSYLCFGTVQYNNIRVCVIDDAFQPTSTQIQVKIYAGSTTPADSTYVNCVFFGTLA